MKVATLKHDTSWGSSSWIKCCKTLLPTFPLDYVWPRVKTGECLKLILAMKCYHWTCLLAGIGEAQLSICVITQPELKKLSWSHSDRAPSKLHWLMSQKLEIILVMESPLVPVTHKTKWLSLFWVWTADTETRVM